MKNVLVTGGCGFLGSHLINNLMDESIEYNIINIDCLNTHASSKNINECNGKYSNYTFFYGNVNDINLVSNILDNYCIDTIIHFAAETDIEDSYKNGIMYTNTNILATQIILEAIKNSNNGIIKKFIYISVADNQYFTPFVASKKAGEIIVESYSKSFGIPIIIVKTNNVFGPKQYIKNVIPNCIYSLSNGIKCKISNYGKSIYSFTYIDDFIEGIKKIINSGDVNKTYYITSDIVLSRIEMIDVIRSLICPEKTLNDVLLFETDEWQMISQFDCAESQNNKIIFPNVTNNTFREGILKTIKWYQSIDLNSYWEK